MFETAGKSPARLRHGGVRNERHFLTIGLNCVGQNQVSNSFGSSSPVLQPLNMALKTEQATSAYLNCIGSNHFGVYLGSNARGRSRGWWVTFESFFCEPFYVSSEECNLSVAYLLEVQPVESF